MMRRNHYGSALTELYTSTSHGVIPGLDDLVNGEYAAGTALQAALMAECHFTVFVVVKAGGACEEGC